MIDGRSALWIVHDTGREGAGRDSESKRGSRLKLNCAIKARATRVENLDNFAVTTNEIYLLIEKPGQRYTKGAGTVERATEANPREQKSLK